MFHVFSEPLSIFRNFRVHFSVRVSPTDDVTIRGTYENTDHLLLLYIGCGTSNFRTRILYSGCENCKTFELSPYILAQEIGKILSSPPVYRLWDLTKFRDASPYFCIFSTLFLHISFLILHIFHIFLHIFRLFLLIFHILEK